MKKTLKILFLSITILFFVWYLSHYKFIRKFFPTNNNVNIYNPTVANKNNNSCLSLDETAEYVSDKFGNKNLGYADFEKPLIINIIDKDTKKIKKSIKIDKISGYVSSISLFPCAVYVTRTFGFDYKNSKPLKDYNIGLWLFDYKGDGKSILTLTTESMYPSNFFTGPFKIDYLEKYISLERSYLSDSNYALVIKDLKTLEDYFVLPISKINTIYSEYNGNIELKGFTKDSRYFWGGIFDQADTLAFVRIDLSNKTWELFKAPLGTMGGDAFNLENGWVTYDDGPPWSGDSVTDEAYTKEYARTGKKVSFYLYNLFSQKKILLETTNDPVWFYKPKWIDDHTLEYTLPDQSKKTYKVE